jgi:hypothetical protein
MAQEPAVGVLQLWQLLLEGQPSCQERMKRGLAVYGLAVLSISRTCQVVGRLQSIQLVSQSSNLQHCLTKLTLQVLKEGRLKNIITHIKKHGAPPSKEDEAEAAAAMSKLALAAAAAAARSYKLLPVEKDSQLDVHVHPEVKGEQGSSTAAAAEAAAAFKDSAAACQCFALVFPSACMTPAWCAVVAFCLVVHVLQRYQQPDD